MLSFDTRNPAPRSSFFFLTTGGMFNSTWSQKRSGELRRRASPTANFVSGTQASDVTRLTVEIKVEVPQVDARTGVAVEHIPLMRCDDVACGASSNFTGLVASQDIVNPHFPVVVLSSCDIPELNIRRTQTIYIEILVLLTTTARLVITSNPHAAVSHARHRTNTREQSTPRLEY